MRTFAQSPAIVAWLKSLAQDARLLAPRKQGKAVLFKQYSLDELATLAELAPLLERATSSPKAAVMPASETLVSFHSVKKPEEPALLDTTLSAPCCEAEPTVLFGCRPCDARGFVVLDRPYLQGKFVDPYYKARREATLIITQACPRAYAACFCNWVGSNPADPEGSDILFTAVDGGFVLEALSPKGEEALARGGFAEENGREDEVKAVQAKAAEGLPPPSTVEDIPARVASRFNDAAFWEEETAKCLSCGACTYLCPTCQCFTITDEGNALTGKRIRSQDTCMSPLFTREASGHNPRAEKWKRMRNRISHKFSYYPASYQGVYSCCGCGRCVVSCPVSLDIRHVVKVAAEGATLQAAPKAAQVAPAAQAAPAAKAEAPKSEAHKADKKSGKKAPASK